MQLFFFLTRGDPHNTSFSLFVKVGICSVRNTGYICLLPIPDEPNMCSMTPSDSEEGGLGSLIRLWWASKLGRAVGFRLLWGRPACIRFFWSSASHLPRSPSDFLSMISVASCGIRCAIFVLFLKVDQSDDGDVPYQSTLDLSRRRWSALP
jgi:hypothetical protein